MDKILEQALLYDFYGELLTAHQKEIYEQFVLDDLSLGEIAADAGISRQGVHDIVKLFMMARKKMIMADAKVKCRGVRQWHLTA